MRVLTIIKLQYLSKIVRSRLKKVAIVPYFFTMVSIIKKRLFCEDFLHRFCTRILRRNSRIFVVDQRGRHVILPEKGEKSTKMGVSLDKIGKGMR